MAGPNKARRWSELSLLDLPEALLISIVKQHLPLKSKIHLQAVSREFRDILRKPHGGSAIWDIIELDDPVFERAHPTALARDPKLAAKEVERKRHVAYRVITRLPALLSSEAELHLDLHFGYVRISLERLEPALGMRHRCNFVERYWADLAGTLTVLQLHGLGIGEDTAPALNQLVRLQQLSLFGSARDAGAILGAGMNLSLAQLQRLTVKKFDCVRLQLNCPQLKTLKLLHLFPLEVKGIPQGVERVEVVLFENVQYSLEKIFQGHTFQQLKYLQLEAPGSYKAPGALEVFERAFSNGRLRHFGTDCPLEKLTPLEGQDCALPKSLHSLRLLLPLQTGLPVMLEQLTNLRELTVINTGEGLMHLDRPLDPFLDMVHFERLEFCSGGMPKKHNKEWTADALRILGPARRRILQGSLLPAGRKVDLIY